MDTLYQCSVWTSYLTITLYFRTMLLVLVRQAEEVLSQTCTLASFPCGLGNGVSIDDRLVGVCLFKKRHMYRGATFFTFLCFLGPTRVVRVSNLGQDVCCGVGVLCTLLV